MGGAAGSAVALVGSVVEAGPVELGWQEAECIDWTGHKNQ